MQLARLASSRARAKTGKRMEAKIDIIDTTTKSSIRVKPLINASLRNLDTATVLSFI
jgi:hypothetical protein